MVAIRPSNERGYANHGWLVTYHTFSFADYHDPKHVHFRALRVINEDRIAPAQGFGAHPHRDMEIITYVLEGALEHKDSTGGGGVIRPGILQAMSAGTGVTHSEFNHSKTAEAHLLQIWIFPERKGLQPRYEEKAIPPESLKDTLRLIASRDGRDGALTVFQDVELFASKLSAGKTAGHKLKAGRHAWLQVARGAVTLNGTNLSAGDGAAVSDEQSLTITAIQPSEFLLFDLA
jgi:redox-sensitive bicupin YhaK (pirin superfamily)